jgi:hypothetical protein
MIAPRITFAGILVAAPVAQTAAQAEPPAQSVLSRTAQDALVAIETNDFDAATDLTARLDDGVQQQLRASLGRDSRERLNEILGLLPADTETLLVLREPFSVHAGELAPRTSGHLVQVCLTERLAAIGNGRFFSALNGETIGLAAAGLSNLRPRGGASSAAASAVMPDADGAWFYVLSAPAGTEAFGQPSESIENRPVWRALSRAPRAEESWIALVRPDLLVMATSRNVLAGILARAAKPGSSRALPANLTEWAQMDAGASAFGLRHYAVAGEMTGLTFAWDAASKRVDLRGLTHAESVPAPLDRAADTGFSIAPPRDGVVKLSAEGDAHGDYPAAVALALLGFGSYR